MHIMEFGLELQIGPCSWAPSHAGLHMVTLATGFDLDLWPLTLSDLDLWPLTLTFDLKVMTFIQEKVHFSPFFQFLAFSSNISSISFEQRSSSRSFSSFYSSWVIVSCHRLHFAQSSKNKPQLSLSKCNLGWFFCLNFMKYLTLSFSIPLLSKPNTSNLYFAWKSAKSSREKLFYTWYHHIMMIKGCQKQGAAIYVDSWFHCSKR